MFPRAVSPPRNGRRVTPERFLGIVLTIALIVLVVVVIIWLAGGHVTVN